jgi:D-alanyl-D-alanine carboxypeptidase
MRLETLMAVRPFMVGLISSTVLVSTLTLSGPAFAQADGRSAQIVVDADTNAILYENNAQASRRPASITKVMTLYLLFDALKKGNISWDDRINFSRNAANQPPTKLFVGAGNSISVQTAVEALVLRSANDVATAVAERLGGSETNFARMMTDKARELGMSSTTFRNASGLPNATQRTTAEDLARLAIAIHRDFPDQYHWFSAQSMTWNGQTIAGHNHLMKRMPGMDGLKTGYTSASGFNLAATTQRSGRRIVTVVLGGANRFQRDDLVEALTESAYRELGVGGPQFAANATAYDINFRDTRDAADAAALIMDLPARRITTGGSTTIAMARTGRTLGFERGAPTFQVADMTRATSPRSGSVRVMPALRDEAEGGATDEEESEAVGTTVTASAIPVPVPVRTATNVPQRNPRLPPMPVPVRVVTPTPVPVPVPVRVVTPVPTPVPNPTATPVPMQMASATIAPVTVPVSVPTPTTVPVIVPSAAPASSVPLRSAIEVAETSEVPKSVQVSQVEVTSAPPPSTSATQTSEIPGSGGLRGSVEGVAATPATLEATAAPAPVPVVVQVAASDPMLTPPVAATPTQEIAVAEIAKPAQVQVAEAAPVTAPPGEAALAQATSTPADAEVQVAAVTQAFAPTSSAAVPEAAPTQMAELAQKDAAALATASPASSELNGSINLAENTAAIAPSAESSAPAQAAEAAPVQMAAIETDAVAKAQELQAQATAREQARMAEAQAVENARREAARVQAAAAARALAERQANDRRAERQLAEARLKAQKEKDAKEALLAQRQATEERAIAARDEERRQAEATRARNARGNAVVQVGAFKDRADANAAIARFSRFFPSFSNGEVSTVSRRDGVWYRARFGGLGAIAAREACNLVSGRGGVCAIVGD